MFPSDFIDHLTRKGVLREPAMSGGTPTAVRRGSVTDVDWLGLTKLTPATFADELAAFYGCVRTQRSDLVGGRFAGQQMSSRFLRERRLFPFENGSGTLALALAAPTEAETVRAVELALRRPVAIAVATSDDIDAALATVLDGERSSAATPADAAVAEDNLDDLRDLARGAPVVRAIDDLLRIAVEQRATDLHIEPFGNVLQVRIRVDGLLRNIPAPPMGMAKGVLSRLKIMAGLNITERRMRPRPHRGRRRGDRPAHRHHAHHARGERGRSPVAKGRRAGGARQARPVRAGRIDSAPHPAGAVRHDHRDRTDRVWQDHHARRIACRNSAIAPLPRQASWSPAKSRRHPVRR
jgi:hypothetical protein